MRAWRYRRLVRWRYGFLALLLVGAAGLLDVTMLRRSTLWPDEIFSLAMATGHSMEHPAAVANAALGDYVQASRPVPAAFFRHYVDRESPPANFSRVIRAVYLSDTSPPLYYVLLNGWTRCLGTTDGRLRLFSVLWALGSIPFIVGIARRVGGWSAAWGAGLLFVAAPNGVYYSTEGRMYSMLWFFVVAAAYLTIRIRDKAGASGWDLLWVAASAAGLLVHYFFVFPWSAMIAYLALKPGRRSRVHLALRLAGALLLVAPWYRHLPDSLRNWRLSGDWLNVVPAHFNRASAICRLVAQYFTDAGYWLWWEHSVGSAVLLIAFTTLALVTIFRLRTRLWARHRPLVIGWLGAAVAGTVVFDLLRHTYTEAVPRYVLSGLPAVAILGGLGLACLPKLPRCLLLAVVLGAWSFDLVSIYENGSRNDQPYWKYGQMLGKEAREGDLILVHAIPTGVIGIARYTQTNARILDWVEQLGTRKVPDDVGPLISGSRRVFLVRIHEVGALAPVETWLREHAVLVQESRFGHSRLMEFRPRERPTF